MTLKPPPKKYLWVWFVCIGLFYIAWLLLLQAEGAWQTAKDHWPIAFAMAIGSYAAGSTPMGGGTVGFPVLVLLFEMPATLGRDFSFAVQSIGMVSASIFILARRQPLAGSMLKGALVGTLFGTPLGLVYLAPLVPELWIKLTFAVLWGSFGVLHLYRINEISSNVGMTEFDERWDLKVGFSIGLTASLLVVSVTGVGIDMALYVALVLLCRTDLKIAIPTSVIVMAFTSVYAVIIKSLTGSWQQGVYENWLAAAPVVALGAPLGVFVVQLISRKPTLLAVSTLCVGQFIWACYSERASLGSNGLLLTVLALGVCLLVFELLRILGLQLVAEARHRNGAKPLGSENLMSDANPESTLVDFK